MVEVGSPAFALDRGLLSRRTLAPHLDRLAGATTDLMVVAALGYVPPTLGALLQEALGVAVILNALRR